jgi:SAM-dependent methyltransferase
VAEWIQQQTSRAAERRRQFVLVRAMVPQSRAQEFRYVNLGAGPGGLDAVLLEHFEEAYATLVDSSLPMLAAARQNLSQFGDRVEYVQANLASPDWTKALRGPFNLIVSTIAIHNLGDARRIRELYAEVHGLLGHGGMFLNLDYMRPARASLAALGPWAAKDKEAALSGLGGGESMPGTVTEQIGWLEEAGFGSADVLWKEPGVALLGAVRDHLHLPGEEHSHSH